jgi:hypothetical protein
MTTLYHCSESSGFGAFVSSVVGAYAVSRLSNSTFVLGSNCTTEASRMNREVARRFHIRIHTVPRFIQTIHVKNRPLKNKITRNTIQDQKLEHPAFCLVNSEHTAIDKLFRGQYGKWNEKRLNYSSYDAYFRETVDRVFKPTQRILVMYNEWMDKKNLTSPYGVLHVRLGDGNMAYNSKRWRWANEQRLSMFRENPVGHLLRVKRNASVVLSDSAWVRELAKSHGFLTMDTTAVHMGMSNNHTSEKDVDGLFLEWFIMHRAEMCFTFDGSMFSKSACIPHMKHLGLTS